MKFFVNLARLLVGSLFIFSGLIKVNDPQGFAIKLKEYFEVFAQDIAPFFESFMFLALPLSVLLCLLEVILGVALLFCYRPKLTLNLLMIVIVFFTFLTFYSAYFNKVTDCGCFGDAIPLTPWQSFTKDLILLVLIGFLIWKRDMVYFKFNENIKLTAVVASVVITLAIAFHVLYHLPLIDFRPYQVGASIEKGMQPSEEYKYAYIMEKDGKQERFEEYPTDTTYTFKEMVLLNPEAQPKITDYSIWNNEGEYTEASFEGEKLFIIMVDAKKAKKGNMEDIQELIDGLNGTSVEPWILTASQDRVIDGLRHNFQLAAPYYFSDATVLKAMIRANPGIMLLKDGVVKGKWSHNDTPDAEDVQEILN